MGDPRKFAAAVAVRRNNKSGGSVPKSQAMIGGAHSVGASEQPADSYDEVDALHRALGSAIVDKVMKAREEKSGPSEPALAHGGEVGPQEDEEEDFLDGSNELADSEFDEDDHSYDTSSGEDEEESEDQTGEGEGGTRSRGPILAHIMSAIRRRQMGRR